MTKIISLSDHKPQLQWRTAQWVAVDERTEIALGEITRVFDTYDWHYSPTGAEGSCKTFHEAQAALEKEHRSCRIDAIDTDELDKL